MNRIINMYRPITTTPFTDNDTYCEILPCEALRPYIRCFWGTKKPLSAQTDADSSGIVIPDTCMDIIFDINYTENNYSGFFCTVDEHSYHTGGAIIADTTATFAIRFYAWTAILFSEEDFTGRKNSAFAVEEFFSKLKAELVPLLFDVPTLDGKIAVTEKILLKKLCTNRINNNLMNAIQYRGKYFNPLPPSGGRPFSVQTLSADYLISIHSLRVEGDSRRLRLATT